MNYVMKKDRVMLDEGIIKAVSVGSLKAWRHQRPGRGEVCVCVGGGGGGGHRGVARG